jgi:hypothetical protein
MMLSKPIAYATLAGTASAWIKLTNPVPFTYDGIAYTANQPLDSHGSDFPCKGVSYNIDQLNTFEAGSTQELNFAGVGTAGGGSCQVSVTTDLHPTKDSVWKVIKSIEGGCPARDTRGNLDTEVPDAYNHPVPFGYNFTVPDLDSGKYTLAWTWFNKVGNREMYMNCAPLEISGGAGSVKLDSLPDMFVANIGNDCITSEGDLLFPNPGADVEQLNGATEAWYTPTGACTTALGSAAPTTVPTTITIADEPPVTTSPPSLPSHGIPIAPEAPAPGTPVEVPEGIPAIVGNNGFFKYKPGDVCATATWVNCIDGHSYQTCDGLVWSDITTISEANVICAVGEAAQLQRYMPLQ